MQVLLDGQLVAGDFPSLASAISAAVNTAGPHRIIIEASADGTPLTDEQLMAPPTTPGGFSIVRFTSANPKDLVRVTLLDAVDVLNGVRPEQAEVADLIQRGETQNALTLLQSVLNKWQAIRDVADRSSQVLGVDLAAVQLRQTTTGATFTSATTDLSRHMLEVKNALKAQDWSLLSDVIGYDLDQQAANWAELFSNFADAVPSLDSTLHAPGPATHQKAGPA
jgi:hypothetical protein